MMAAAAMALFSSAALHSSADFQTTSGDGNKFGVYIWPGSKLIHRPQPAQRPDGLLGVL
jgi:hypothetical protein